MPHDGLKCARCFTTTQAAKLCGLCHMTIIRHFDAGDIKGFRVPGSRFRRIPREDLVDFAKRHGIPLPALDDVEATAPVEGNGGERAQRALVVEDDYRMAALLEKVLVSDGWEVRVARDGFDAGLQAMTFHPRLVLLDIMLPGLDGREVCRWIKAVPQLAATRILAVTALQDENSKEEIKAAGVDGYLAKPFAVEELREQVRELTPPGAENRAAAGAGPWQKQVEVTE